MSFDMMGRDPGQGDVICHPSTATKGIPASVDFGRWESRYCSLVAVGYPRIKPGWKGREVWLSQSSPLTPGLAFQRSARLKKHLPNISADSTSDYIKFCLFHHHTLLSNLTPMHRRIVPAPQILNKLCVRFTLGKQINI